MKKIIAIILFINISISVFSQNDSLKKHEISIIYQQNWQTGVWDQEGHSDNDGYGYWEWLNFTIKYSNSIGIRYKYNLNYNNIFNIEILKYDINIEHYRYSSSRLDIPIGYSYKFWGKSKFSPYIGIFILNGLTFNEKTRNGDFDFRYQFGISPKLGLALTIKKRIVLNIEGFEYFNKFSFSPNPSRFENFYYHYYYRIVGVNLSLGYKF